MRDGRIRSIVVPMSVLAWFVAAAPVEAADLLRIRRDAYTLSSSERQLFIDAIFAMKAAPARGDGTLATNRYDEYVRLHEIFRLHMNSGFLPWHRKMMWEFETEIRQLDPVKFGNFTMPYWNLTRGGFPSDLVGGIGSPVVVTDGPFAAGLWTTVNPGPETGTHALERPYLENVDWNFVGSPELLFAMIARDKDFESFSMDLEISWHNRIHNTVGGQFGTIAGAVDDPFFWLLHTWVDMAWTLWQANTGSTTADDYMAFMDGPDLDDRMDGFGDPTNLTNIGFNATMFNTPRDQLDPRNTASLGYNYEFLGNLILPPVIVPEPRSLILAALSAMALACFARARPGQSFERN